jgi:hypothetical protein
MRDDELMVPQRVMLAGVDFAGQDEKHARGALARSGEILTRPVAPNFAKMLEPRDLRRGKDGEGLLASGFKNGGLVCRHRDLHIIPRVFGTFGNYSDISYIRCERREPSE